MKTFDRLRHSRTRCRREVLELRARLATTRPLKEREEILPFFRARPHLSALCGLYHPRLIRYNLLAWEYDIFGDFVSDLAVGDSVSRCYTFVEFEDAGPNSLFVKQGRRATREWSPRFDRGYGQIIDWFYKVEGRRNSDECEARFGKRAIDYAGLLVIGREAYLDAGERLRLEWRREHVIVHSRRIHCVTYDELVGDMLAALKVSAAPPLDPGRGTRG